jgi:hypothetical protein
VTKGMASGTEDLQSLLQTSSCIINIGLCRILNAYRVEQQLCQQSGKDCR